MHFVSQHNTMTTGSPVCFMQHVLIHTIDNLLITAGDMELEGCGGSAGTAGIW
jgi:hypothetical protein